MGCEKACRLYFFEFHPGSLDPENQVCFARYIQHVHSCELGFHEIIDIRSKDRATAYRAPFFKIHSNYFIRALQSSTSK